ncbi:transposase [Endozoicomonas sp. GU-1]|uniref:transposase n=1 Tax=Endozoicomonas sp. GU-1 TaxID=3009078 RepID=UPI003FA453F2
MSSPKFKDSPAEFNQHLMFPTNIFDLLPPDHDCFVFEDIFRHIDTSEVEKQYHHLGQNAYHPRLIISILIYAYSHGVFSSREIERRCNQDLAFMYIAKQHCPNFRVLSDFRKDQSVFFHSSFKQSVLLAHGFPGSHCSGWLQIQSQYIKAQGHELWATESQRSRANGRG